MITIVDYGLGNLGSIKNMFKYLGVAARVSGDLEEIAAAEKLLLPGVGAFDKAMTRINAGGLREVLDRKALQEKIPVLGICLGMQLLTLGSEEGTLDGLGWVPAHTRRFPPAPGIKVPHMGWNVVQPAQPSRLTKDLPEQARFYFVHSYYVKAADEKHAILTAHHGVTFDAAVQCDNIYGAQFHPEKSHKFGMRIIENFAAI